MTAGKTAQRLALMFGVMQCITGAQGQVPANIETGLRKIGPIVDPACTAMLYRSLMPAEDITSDKTPLYKALTVKRDQSFGPHPKDVVDIFYADKGPASRPVLIFVPGGAGDKIESQAKEANAFYDNIGRWATKNGMVSVNMQRHASLTWDGGARDVSKMIQWLQTNIKSYHGNPERMYIWAHSAGNLPLGTYIGHPELYGPSGVGVRGVIFMSPAPFNIAPLNPVTIGGDDPRSIVKDAGKTCSAGSIFAVDGALPGRGPGQPGGPPEAAAPPGLPPSPIDPAILLAQSSLPELRRTKVKIMLANAELDPSADINVNGGAMPYNQVLHDELCKEGAEHCPAMFIAKGHSHMSIVFSLDTPDNTVGSAILRWLRTVP